MRGHTLSELLIASTIGLFILAGALLMYSTSSAANQRLQAEYRLQQALSSAAAFISGELRRAGYWSRARNASSGGAINGYAPLRLVGSGCVLYSYDRDQTSTNGAPRAQDQFGLRIVGGALQVKTSDDNCAAVTCAACNSGVWIAVTDPSTLTVTALDFAADNHERTLTDGSTLVIRGVNYQITGRAATGAAIQHTVTGFVNVRNDEIR
jgi:type II secretory pathway component PulJ